MEHKMSEVVDASVEAIYDVLSPEELFRRAKVHSWQSFFHHSASVALISYRLGELIKKNLQQSVDRHAIDSIESTFKIRYEALLFYVGLAHDYVKLHRGPGGTGESRIKDVLVKLMSSDPRIVSGVDVASLAGKIVKLAMAVEGEYEPELEESLIRYVAPLVRVADVLMSKSSLDEALRLLVDDALFRRLSEDYGLRFGYVKVSIPSMLYAKISERVVNVLRSYGWVPLAIYADGLVLVGGSDSRNVPLSEIENILEREVLSAFETRKRVEELISKLGEKPLAKIFNYLESTRASTKLSVDVGKGSKKEKGDASAIAYHNLIVTYLTKKDLKELIKEFNGLKDKLGEKKLFDPRTLATGLGKGSTYFDTLLKTMVTSPHELAEIVTSIKDRMQRFLLLSYVMAFASDDVSVVKDVLAELGVVVPEEDAELIRLIAIAEAYSRLNRDGDVKKVIQFVVKRLGVHDMKPYIRRVLMKIRSNVVNVESMKLHEVSKTVYKSYCRICGELVEPTIRYIEYSKDVKGAGGASEIWLHDDPPLADLEKLASDFRHICPICYYESQQVKDGYRPPFLVLALHPVISYDLWQYIVRKVVILSGIKEMIKEKTWDVASNFESLAKNLKLTKDVADQIKKSVEGKSIGPLIFDSFGARVLLPFGREASIKKRDSAIALALAPIAMVLAGGGQVGLVGSIADAYNLGVEPYPLVLPLPSPLVEEVVSAFEKVKIERRRVGKDLTLPDYAVYDKSYVTLLKVLLAYGLKVFAWYGRWRTRQGGLTDCEDYALQLHEFMTSVPYIPLSLASPAPESLYPASDENPIPYYNLLFSLSSEVEKSMSEPQEHLGKETPLKLIGAITLYAKLLKELSNMLKIKLTRHDIQAPLRNAVDVMLEYLPAIGEKDAVKLATDKLLHVLEVKLAVNLETISRTTKEGKQESYREAFSKVFKAIAKAVLKIRREYPSSKCRRFIEVMLDSAYERYRHLKSG